MRRISLAVLSLMTLATLASACGLATNTLAQDLAWERWEKCNRFRGITLKEIKTDGHIWVWVADGGEQTAWRECERQAAREQGARRPATSPTSPLPLTAATAAVGPIPVPVWKVGSEWAYRYEQPSGTGTFVWSVDRVAMVGGQPHYVIKTGTREIFYRVSDLAFTQETANSTLVRQVTPSDWRWVAFPLTSGKSWEMQYHEERPADRRTEDVRRACTAEAEETVTVPAGTFSVMRVACTNLRNGAWLVTVWYSPQVAHIVREESSVTGGKRLRELISYRLR